MTAPNDSTAAGEVARVRVRASKTVQLSGGTIRYQDTGHGDSVIFLHGLLVNGELWRNVVPTLAEDNRCLVLDLPLGGHAVPMDEGADLSPGGLARLLLEFFDALELDRATLVANDTGGAIAQVFVAHYPERVSRLVLTNCDAFENFLPPVLRPLQWGARFVPGFVPSLCQALKLKPVKWVLAKLVTKHGISEPVMRSYLENAIDSTSIRRDLRKALAGISSSVTLDAALRFTSFVRPVLVAWGDEDRLFSYRYAERLAAAFPNSTIERIPDAHAFVPEDNPARLTEILQDFLVEVRAEGVTARV